MKAFYASPTTQIFTVILVLPSPEPLLNCRKPYCLSAQSWINLICYGCTPWFTHHSKASHLCTESISFMFEAWALFSQLLGYFTINNWTYTADTELHRTGSTPPIFYSTLRLNQPQIHSKIYSRSETSIA